MDPRTNLEAGWQGGVAEAISAEQIKGELSGTVEVDGAYLGGHVCKENEAKDRKDRRKARRPSRRAA